MTTSKILDSKDFFIILLMVIGILWVLFRILKYTVSRNNSKMPIQTSGVKIISKGQILGFHNVVVEFETGQRRGFDVRANIASSIDENDRGKLTYQGTEIIKFEPYNTPQDRNGISGIAVLSLKK